MARLIDHVTASEFSSEAALTWEALFASVNGPRRDFLGAYSARWFDRAVLKHGLEVFVARERRSVVGVVTVFFNLAGLPPGHGLEGVFVDNVMFGDRLGHVGFIAGEAYRPNGAAEIARELSRPVIERARACDLDALAGSLSVEPFDPCWALALATNLPAFVEPAFDHPVHDHLKLRRVVFPLKPSATCTVTSSGIRLC